jgi:uncharacterized protein (TIGR02099 family)
MPADQKKPSSPASRLGVCWRLICQSYRHANRVTHHVLGFLLKTLVLAWLVFGALFLSLRYLVLPNIDVYKGNIEQLASRTVGRPVSIERIYASWDGLRPHLILGDVVLRDKDGRPALSLPGISATLSWWSLVVADLRFHSLEISRPDLDIRREADGKLYVAGIFLDPNQSGDGKGLDWVLSQDQIVIREGSLHWTDQRRAAPELVLEHVTLLLQNQWRHHKLGFKATPPAAFAAPLDLRADFAHPHFSRRISDFTLWKGVLFTDLADTDLTVWKPFIDYPVELQQGKGSVRAWLNFDHAKIANFTADLTLSNVSARLGKDLPLLNLAQVAGRISAREDYVAGVTEGTPTFGAHGHALSLTDFSVQTDDGMVLPPTTISETWVPAKKGAPEKTEIKAALLDLALLANFAERLPLSPAQRQFLADFVPRGQLKDFSGQWQGAYPDISAYRLKGQFAGLGLKAQPARPARPRSGNLPAQAAMPAIPGFENLTGSVVASDQGGNFTLASDKLAFHLPGYFSDPLMPFEQLAMKANWTFTDKDQLLLQVEQMNFVQDGVVASLSGKHLMPLKAQQGKPLGTVDLSGKIARFDAKKIGRYLPLQTPPALQHWLTGALVDGEAQDVSVKLKGDLAYFPFGADDPVARSRGEFSVVGKIVNGKLNYAPGEFAKDGKAPLWPLAEAIQGSIKFDRTRLEVRGDSAKTHGTVLSNVKAVIPNILADDMLLQIDGNAAGALQDFVRYVNVTPVIDWIANFTEETKGSGNAKLALKLDLPLARLPEAKVQGSLQLAGNDVVLQNVIPPLLQASGKIEFNEKGFNLNGISASFLGGPVAVSGGTQRDGSIQVRASGSASSEGLRKTYPVPAIQRLSQHIIGSARYTTTINVKKHHPEIVVESNLQGLALDFPAPLGKASSEALPFRFQLSGLPAEGETARDEMTMTLGSGIAARYQRQKGSGKEAEWRVVKGGIGVNVPPPEPDSGVIANVNVKSLNVDAWRSVVASIVGNGSDKPKTEAPAEGGAADALNISQYIEPEVLAARAATLQVMGKQLNNVVVGASHQKNVWQANIDAAQASGYLTWYESASGQGLGKVTARLASLVIPQSAASDVGELLEGKNTATQIPALDVMADNFELFGKKLGRLEVVASNVQATIAREWRISKLSLINPDAQLKAAGKWVAREGDNATSLTYALDVANAGKLLERFGFANVLRGGKGKLDGDVSWKGLPFSLDIPSLSGQIHLDMAAGQFLKMDPGAAKLLGVLSLQSLPRRLALDFRDVFSEGFAFDGISATAEINQGVLQTDNLKMLSVNATVLMNGTVDIARESQNLHVVVIPDINAGAASVVYALAVNPVIGLGTFLAQLFLRDPLMRAFTFEYQITGPWKDPAVIKLATRSGSTAPAPATTTTK